MTTPLQEALEKAPVRSASAKAAATRELFVFKLGEFTMALESVHVREVTRSGPLTPLPRMPSYLLGVGGQRGEVLPVVDLLRFFSRGESTVTERTRLFICSHQSWTVAFVADSVVGLQRFEEAKIFPAPVGGGDLPIEFLGGVLVGPKSSAIALLNLPRLLSAARTRAVSR